MPGPPGMPGMGPYMNASGMGQGMNLPPGAYSEPPPQCAPDDLRCGGPQAAQMPPLMAPPGGGGLYDCAPQGVMGGLCGGQPYRLSGA